MAEASNRLDHKKISTNLDVMPQSGFCFFCRFSKKNEKSEPLQCAGLFFKVLGVVFLSGFFIHQVSAATLITPAENHSTFWHMGGTTCYDWETCRSGSYSLSYSLVGNGGGAGVGAFPYGGNGWDIMRTGYSFDLTSILNANDTIQYAAITVYGEPPLLNTGLNNSVALYVSNINGDPFTSSAFNNMCGSSNVQLASVNSIQTPYWKTDGSNTFVLNSAALQRISEERFSNIIFCLKDVYYDQNDHVPPSSAWDFVANNSTTPATLQVVTSEATSTTQTFLNSGLRVNNIWSCCAGECGNEIFAPVQLGWFGISTTTSRQVLYGLDNDCVSNPLRYYIDFTNVSQATSTIATSTTNGWHTFCLDYYLNNVYQFRYKSSIQIISGAGCYATSSPGNDINNFCDLPCSGIATSTNPLDYDNLLCALRKFGCWLMKPTPESIAYVQGQFNGLTDNFPMAPIKAVYTDLTIAATGTQALAPGMLALPIYQSSTGQYISQNFDLGSSTMTISHGYVKFKRFLSILFWTIFAALPTVLVLWALIMPL